MKRTKIIDGAFFSYQPTGSTTPWGEGYKFHENQSEILNYPGFQITGMRTIDDQMITGTTLPVDNDVYVDYSYLSGNTVVTGTVSIYAYPTTTNTTTLAPATTTTTLATITTTTTTAVA